MTTMFFNCGIAQFHKSKERIAHLGDRGSENHHEQLDSAHSVISEWERRHGNSNAGAIAFDFDHRVSALQAADAIAWTLHRQRESEQFGNDFLPLLALSEKQYGPTGKSVRQLTVWLFQNMRCLHSQTRLKTGLIQWENFPLQQMPEEVQRFVSSIKLSAKTAKNLFATMQMLWKSA